MSSEEITVCISTLAIILSKGKTVDELNKISLVLTQLADTILTIAGFREKMENE